MKIKTSTLIDLALDYAVAMGEGGTGFHYDTIATYWIKINGKDRALAKGWTQSFTPSTDWAQGGSIIEREKISIQHTGDAAKWYAHVWDINREDFFPVMYGPTPLIAAMRCFVASKLGNEVEIPGELLK